MSVPELCLLGLKHIGGSVSILHSINPSIIIIIICMGELGRNVNECLKFDL